MSCGLVILVFSGPVLSSDGIIDIRAVLEAITYGAAVRSGCSAGYESVMFIKDVPILFPVRLWGAPPRAQGKSTCHTPGVQVNARF